MPLSTYLENVGRNELLEHSLRGCFIVNQRILLRSVNDMEMLCVFSVDEWFLWHGAKASVRVTEELLSRVCAYSVVSKKKKKKKSAKKSQPLTLSLNRSPISLTMVDQSCVKIKGHYRQAIADTTSKRFGEYLKSFETRSLSC